MATTISKIRLINFKRFQNYTVIPNSQINILVGDNEVGKSSILEAIDIVSSGNIKKVESIGIDNLFNIDTITQFNAGKRSFSDLPRIIIELYLNGDFDHTMNGRNNLDSVVCDGIRMICAPNPDYQTEIVESMKTQDDYFPYDYYSIRFSTFADEGYTGYKKKLKSVFIDSANMNSDYATNDFIKRMYFQYTEDNLKERATHKSKYRQMKNAFCSDNLSQLNSKVPTDKYYTFGLKKLSANGIENDLMIYENEIGIDNKGTGKQVFIKTDFALERSGDGVDVILIEEPENHLSHVNLRKLIQRVADTKNGQLFITTHNSLISTRLELNNLLIMHSNSATEPMKLSNLSNDTAKYFMKAPPAGIIEFALSERVILVEGPSEYMLLEKFYEGITGNKPESDNVHIIDIRGLSFKRFLEIACLINSKVVVITDNDKDYQTHCVDKYSDYIQKDNVKICYCKDNAQRTFEVVLYNINTALCDSLFNSNSLEYMLKNKTEAAYKLLETSEKILVPDYIKEAIEWIKK